MMRFILGSRGLRWRRETAGVRRRVEKVGDEPLAFERVGLLGPFDDIGYRAIPDKREADLGRVALEAVVDAFQVAIEVCLA